MRKKDAYWSDIFTQYKESGLTRPAFCRQKNVSYSQFQYRWNKQKPIIKTDTKASLMSPEPHNFEKVAISSLSKESNPVSNELELIIFLPNQIRCDIKTGLRMGELPALLKQLVVLC